MRFLFSATFLFYLCLQSAFAQDGLVFSVTGNVSRVNLVELYTSEGCSSCPPAEAWLSNLKNHEGLWRDVVPVAFHVDYWDNLGWKDRYASPVFTHRQRLYRDAWKGRYIYTPALAVNGQPWQDWRLSTAVLPLETNNVGTIELTFEDNTLNMNWNPIEPFAKAYDAYVTVIGFGIESNVKAGENSGRTLTHDFVVLQYAQRRVKQRKGQYYDRMPLDLELSKGLGERAIVVWITQNREVYPLQAVGVKIP
ncbi:MAG: hypothetical protein ACI9OU_000089 [Candidatus Promineifilaceae bacterium]|jgi:hypothetical protein